MAEYITKQEARTALLQRAWKPNEWHDIKSLISSITPADVRPVVRGKWEHLNWGFDYDRCSVCGYEHRWPGPFYFCPHCGADMKEETK